MDNGKAIVLEIHSLEELYKFTNDNFKCKDKEYYSNRYFFRGQADRSWELEPGINRGGNKKEWEELKCPEPISTDLFTYISKCQHYNNNKTRFLDFTTSIDIALYFACENSESTDASIYACSYTPRMISWGDVFIISELAFVNEEVSVLDLAKKLLAEHDIIRKKFKNEEDLSMNIVSWLDHGFMVLPSESEYNSIKTENRRMYNQKGAFFVCGNKTKIQMDSRRRWRSNAGKNIILPEVANVPRIMKEGYRVHKIIIPSYLKADALDYLKTKSVDENYIYDINHEN